MTEFSTLAKRATRSMVALISRTFILNAINFLGALALTIFLTAEEFGTFIIASTSIEILTYFADIGLAGALIQKKTDLQKEEIEATFTIQQTLILSGILIAIALTKPIQSFYGLSQPAIWLFYALLASFFISSLKTIPTVLAERQLEFNKIIIPQIIEAVFFNGIVVIMAWQGWGILSYVVAVLARSIVGTVTMFILVPWQPRIRFSIASIKGLLKFGVPFQTNSLIAVFKDKVSLLILGKVIGIQGVGMVGWAEKWANLPLRYMLDAIIKVSFPLFSRLQDDLPKAKSAIEKSLYFVSITIFPALVGFYLLMPEIIETLPKYTKWSPALPVFNFFLISAAIGSVSTLLTNFLTAMGRMRQMVGMMLLWTILTLVLYPLFASWYGIWGVGLASLIVSSTSFIPYLLVRKIVPIQLSRSLLTPLIGSLTMLVILVLIKPWLGTGISQMILVGTIGAVIYISVIYLFDRAIFMQYLNQFLIYVKAKA